MIDPRQPDYTNTPCEARRTAWGYAPTGHAAPAPMVSIVTAFYNTDEVFDQTAACVLGQSLQNWEWLIVNDGSTKPQARAVLDRYRELGRQDARIRVLDMPANAGPSAARNFGYRHARAELVYQLDSDDLIEPTCLEKHAWFLATHPHLAAVSSHEVGFGAQRYLWGWGFHTPELFLKECPVGAHAVMVRRSAHAAVGGYDESIRGGMEDWEFWLRLADHGSWGGNIPEHLSWYRRREQHSQQWADWDGGERQKQFHERLRQRFPRLFAQGVRPPAGVGPMPFDAQADVPEGFANPLRKDGRRLLMLVPWFEMGGADKFNLRMLQQLRQRGWGLSVASTLRAGDAWLSQFAGITPDVFALHRFLPARAYPAFVRYLLESRRPDVVMVTNSELGYWLLPFMRSVWPRAAYVDYVHMEEEYWKSGGYPRYTAGCSDELDGCMVSSEHLKRWVVSKGGNAARVDVCTTNEDTEEWKPDATVRDRVRSELGIAGATPVILYAGRICAQKQPRVFARTIELLEEQKLDFVALVAGDGVDRPMLEDRLAKSIARGSVRMLGAVPNARMKELVASSDVFFLPSHWEGISLAIYEAMAGGLAIVGADVGGQRELVTPDTGVLISLGDEQAQAGLYAGHLASLIRDGEKRRAMARAARARVVEHFPLCAMGDRMEALLRQGLERARERVERGVGAPVLDARTAAETARRAIEFARVHDLADHLWSERERLHAQLGALAPMPRAGAVDGAYRGAAADELRELEGSFAWRVVGVLKNNPLYALWARARWGPGWNTPDPHETPEERLARLRASRGYRLIHGVKSSGMYRGYRRLRGR